METAQTEMCKMKKSALDLCLPTMHHLKPYYYVSALGSFKNKIEIQIIIKKKKPLLFHFYNIILYHLEVKHFFYHNFFV